MNSLSDKIASIHNIHLADDWTGYVAASDVDKYYSGKITEKEQGLVKTVQDAYYGEKSSGVYGEVNIGQTKYELGTNTATPGQSSRMFYSGNFVPQPPGQVIDEVLIYTYGMKQQVEKVSGQLKSQIAPRVPERVGEATERQSGQGDWLSTIQKKFSSKTSGSDREWKRVRQLDRFLRESSAATSGPLITHSTAKLAWQAWKSVSSQMGSAMPVPSAGIGPDGQVLYTWDRADHHLELEIFPDGPAEFFYRNRLTDETWEIEYKVGDPIPLQAVSKLVKFKI